KFLTADGHLHSIEPVLPENAGMPRWLALHDRGKFPRSLSAWREIFTDKLETVIFEPFPVRHLGHSIVELVYFKGRTREGRHLSALAWSWRSSCSRCESVAKATSSRLSPSISQ